MMVRMRRERLGTEEQITPQIDNLILIDRTVDLLTPFLSQLTYEGFIDELFNIKNSEFEPMTLLLRLLFMYQLRNNIMTFVYYSMNHFLFQKQCYVL